MPENQETTEAKARLFSLYMRPWVLLDKHASQHVPPLAKLGHLPVQPAEAIVKRRRLSGKQPSVSHPSDRQQRNYAETWRWWVRGHICSRHQRKIVVQFMAANCGKSSTRDADVGDDAEELKEDEPETMWRIRRHGAQVA